MSQEESEKTTLESLLKLGLYLQESKTQIILQEWEARMSGSSSAKGSQSMYSDILGDVFSGSTGDVLRSHSGIEKQVLQDLVSGLNELEKYGLTNHPYVEEEIDYNNWAEQNPQDQDNSALLSSISNYYTDEQFNLKFFEDKIEEMNRSKKVDESMRAALAEQMLERWDAQLTRKKDVWYFNELEKFRKKFVEELYKQTEQFLEMKDILAPFTDEVGRLWDLSKGFWKDVNFEILRHHAQLIKEQPEFLELAKYLGRMQAERSELIEEKIQSTSLRPEFITDKSLKEELVGIRESNDINNLLSSEVALLGNEQTELLFFLKLSERKLLTYDFHGFTSVQKEVETEELTQREDDEKEEMGPIIICVDTSGSMAGPPERVAKTLCFAILREALLQQRKCFLITFSTGIKTLELSNLEKDLTGLIKFLSFSFHGGTDATPALQESLRALTVKDYERADVLMISDFVMGSLPDSIRTDIKNQQEKDTRFHSLVIASSGNQQVIDVFDNNWVYDASSQKPFKQILEKLEGLRQRSESQSKQKQNLDA